MLSVSALQAAFETLDDRLGHQLRGVPFCVSPGRKFWREHQKCTWYEVLEVDPSDVNDAFSAMGIDARKGAATKLAQYGLHLVNGQDGHPSCPYGKDDDGGRIKWLTYKEILKPPASVQAYHDRHSLSR